MPARIFLITGTDTGVGKTISTAALTRYFLDTGNRVGVIKPVQSGVGPGEEGDIDTIIRLTGIAAEHAIERVRLPEPLAPTQAAQRANIPLIAMHDHAAFIDELASEYDVLLVEGAGGVSVALDDAGETLIDLAHHLQDLGHYPQAIIVNRAGLGTLNHTRLTLWMLATEAIKVVGMIVGAAPAPDDLAGQLNMEEMGKAPYPPIITVVPDGLGDLDQASFAHALATAWATRPVQVP